MTTSVDEVRRYLMSWEEYQSLPSSLCGEYVDGALTLTPAPDRLHQRAVLYLAHLLASACEAGEEATAAWGWKPGADEFAPDVMVVPATDEIARFTGTPLLVVEVTSGNYADDVYADDVVKKRAKYAEAGLCDYWIVDRRANALRCHELRDGLLIETEQFTGGGVVKARFAGRVVDVELGHLFFS